MFKRKKKVPLGTRESFNGQEICKSQRLSCIFGIFIIITIALLGLILGTYLILRPHPEPPLDAFLTANTCAAFVLNLNLNSPPLGSLAQKLFRTHTSGSDEQIQKNYEGLQSAINFFFYPRVYLLLLDSGRPDSLSTVGVVNFRRAQILFKLLIAKTMRKLSASLMEQANISRNLNQFFLKNSWLITDDYSALSTIKAKRGRIDTNAPAVLQEFAQSVRRDPLTDELIIGCVDNSNNWVGKLINVWHTRATQTSASQSSEWWHDIIIEFLSQDEWQELPWKTISKILVRGKLLSADTLSLQFKVFITNPQLTELIRTALREKILPDLKRLLMEDYSVSYYTTIGENVVTITLELQHKQL